MDIALCVEKLMGVAEYGTATTYEDLVRTWRDERPPPTLEQLEAVWPAVRAEQDEIVANGNDVKKKQQVINNPAEFNDLSIAEQIEYLRAVLAGKAAD
jgi:hypothetical protein